MNFPRTLSPSNALVLPPADNDDDDDDDDDVDGDDDGDKNDEKMSFFFWHLSIERPGHLWYWIA